MSTAEKENTKGSRFGFWVSLTAFVVLLLAATVVTTAYLVREALSKETTLSPETSKIVLMVARLPNTFDRVWAELTGNVENEMLKKKESVEQPHWVRQFPAPEDDGYLLFSGYEPKVKMMDVQLIRIADGKVMADWPLDWNAIYSQMTDKKFERKGRADHGVSYHPLLLDNGDIIFNTGKSLVRSNLCSTKPVWVNDQVIHHSIEMASDGTSIWAPGVTKEFFLEAHPLLKGMRDDSIARISFDGKILENTSVSKILVENGLRSLLLGTSGHVFREDPIHLNQIHEALSDTKHWKRGDLLLSLRSLSTVMIYRPSTGKVIWHQLGPWTSQHAALFVDDHRISVFDNNSFSGAPTDAPFARAGDTNRVLIHDFDTGQTTEPYATLLANEKPVTWNQGLARVLPDGGLFLEETNNGRHLRYTKDKLLWSRINDFDDKHVGIAAWSRYLTPQEAAKPLAAIAAMKCQ
jgi:hypothetical protein